MKKAKIFTFNLFFNALLVALFTTFSTAEEQIQNLTINQAVEIALKENPDLNAARYQVKEAEGRLKQAGLYPNPSLETDFNFDAAFSNEGERNFSTGIVQPLPLSGRIGAQKNAAKVDVERTFANIADIERLLVKDVRLNFIQYLAVNEQLLLQENLIGLNTELIKGIKKGIKEGLASERDLNSVVIALQQARQEKEVLIAQKKSIVLELSGLLGKPPTFSFTTNEKLSYDPVENLSDHNAESAYINRPDFKLSKSNIEFEKANLALAKALRFEDIDAGIFYSRDRQILDIPQGAIPNTDNLLGIRLVIPLPFFDRKQGLIAETIARRTRAEVSNEALKIKIDREVSDALNRVNTLSALLGTYQSGILITAEKNVKLVENGFKQGLAGITDVIQSRQQFSTLTSSYINTLRDYHIALNDLQTAVGIYPHISSFNNKKGVENR
ncbi:MAG: TolC family protein [Thermodesulfobacteriota bacterium]